MPDLIIRCLLAALRFRADISSFPRDNSAHARVMPRDGGSVAVEGVETGRKCT